MFPVATAVPTAPPAPPSLVATPLPANFAERAPYTDVSPSVSSVQISNNARGNGSYIPMGSVAQYPVSVAEGDAATGAAGSVASSKIPATFLAQMIGQGVPLGLQSQLSSVLASYDQMVTNSFVKYKPSNATLPPPPPAGVFGRILAQEQIAPEPSRAEAQPATQQPGQTSRSQEVPVQQVERVIAPQTRQTTPAERAAPQQTQPKRTGASPVKAAIAYLMSDARVELETPPAVKATA